MPPRPTWKGHLRLSLVTCAVKLTPATSQREHVRFHLLNAATNNRVREQWVDEKTGDVVERKRTVKGYEAARGRYVVVGNDELDKLKIESTHTIDIERFVERSELDPLYLDKPYFMEPDGKLATEAFAVIREAMRHQAKIGIARLVLAQREHVVAIEPYDRGMSVTTLRAPNDVRSAKSVFGAIKPTKVDQEMLKIAESIIATKRGAFEPNLFEDRYQAALRALVEAKIKGHKFTAPRSEPPAKVVDLMQALRKSLAQSGAQGQGRRTRPARGTARRAARRQAAGRRKAS